MNKKTCDVEVVVCNYNYGIYIAELIESIINQSVLPQKLTVVDDGSTDNSLEKLYGLTTTVTQKIPTYLICSLKENRGKLAALNYVADQLSEEITLIVDADDILHKNFLEETVGLLKSYHEIDPHIGFLYTDSLLVDAQNRYISIGKSAKFDSQLLKTRSYIPECGPTFTKALQQIFPLDESIKIGTKHHKWLRLVNHGWRGIHLKKPLFNYRMHNENISRIGKRVLNKPNKYKSINQDLSNYWVTQNTR